MLKWKLAQTLELRWWKHYLGPKSPTSYLAWKSDYWQTFLRRLDLELLPNIEVLDAGCGPAGIFTILKEQRVVAIDPLLSSYASALHEHFPMAAYPNVRFYTQRLEEVSWESAFDLVFCLNVINHVADIRLALERLSAALRPNGLLVLSTDVHNHAFFKHLFRRVPLDALHPHQYNLAEYEQLLPDDLSIRQSVCYQKEFFFDYHVWVLQKKS